MKQLLALSILLGAAEVAQAGEVSKRAYSRNYEWESTDCYKPTVPMVFSLDEFTQMQIESYLDDVAEFKQCVEAEAESDFTEASRKIADAMQEGIDRAHSEVNSDLRSLETSIMMAQ